jgi:hypothetical protein
MRQSAIQVACRTESSGRRRSLFFLVRPPPTAPNDSVWQPEAKPVFRNSNSAAYDLLVEKTLKMQFQKRGGKVGKEVPALGFLNKNRHLFL